MKRVFLLSALCVASPLFFACDNQREAVSPPAPKSPPAVEKTVSPDPVKEPAPAEAVNAASSQATRTISGKVLETMNTGGYTYLHVDTGNKQQWVAMPETTVSVGETVTCYDGMVMPNFTSKSLNKTFESVIFSNGLVGKEGGVNPHGMGGGSAGMDPQAGKPEAGSQAADSFAGAVKAEEQAPGQGPSLATDGQAKMESGGSLGAMAPFANVKVAKAAGENGYTVEEVFTKGSALDGKVIRVRGKVIKFSPNIMGKNWIHLQDGSGDPLQSSHDLVVTTSAQPAAGQEIVLIEGTVRTNKDFGAGYKYVALVEDATIIQE